MILRRANCLISLSTNWAKTVVEVTSGSGELLEILIVSYLTSVIESQIPV